MSQLACRGQGSNAFIPLYRYIGRVVRRSLISAGISALLFGLTYLVLVHDWCSMENLQSIVRFNKVHARTRPSEKSPIYMFGFPTSGRVGLIQPFRPPDPLQVANFSQGKAKRTVEANPLGQGP